MNRRYSYKEIEQGVLRRPDDFHPLSVEEILDMLREAMHEANVDEHARVWEWPAMDKQLEEAYRRAMSIL